jgi:hypothetical protein
MALEPLPAFSDVEREVLILDAVWDLADGLLNRSNVWVHVDDQLNVEMRFNSMEAGRLFSILLVDLLSEPSSDIMRNQADYLKALLLICEAPSFDPAHDIDELRDATASFNNWLEFPYVYPQMWLPSIDRECDIRMTRKETLKIVGNLSKHNFTRLTASARNIRQYLTRTEVHVSATESMMLLEDFEVQFYDDVFHCYRNMLAFHINRVRRSMRNYLMHKRHTSARRNEHGLVYFARPQEIPNDYVASVFIRLMGRVTGNHMYESFGVAQVYRDMF